MTNMRFIMDIMVTSVVFKILPRIIKLAFRASYFNLFAVVLQMIVKLIHGPKFNTTRITSPVTLTSVLQVACEFCVGEAQLVTHFMLLFYCWFYGSLTICRFLIPAKWLFLWTAIVCLENLLQFGLSLKILKWSDIDARILLAVGAALGDNLAALISDLVLVEHVVAARFANNCFTLDALLYVQWNLLADHTLV